MNQIATELLTVGSCLEGCECFKNDSVESDCMVNSVEYDRRDKYDVNETADRYIVWNHSTRGFVLKW